MCALQEPTVVSRGIQGNNRLFTREQSVGGRLTLTSALGSAEDIGAFESDPDRVFTDGFDCAGKLSSGI